MTACGLSGAAPEQSTTLHPHSLNTGCCTLYLNPPRFIMDELESINFVTIEFQGYDGGRENITLSGIGEDGVYLIYSCTDIVFDAMARADLFMMHSLDGKLAKPSNAGIEEWLNYLELKHGPIKILEGKIPAGDFVDPQSAIEEAFAINLQNEWTINEKKLIEKDLENIINNEEVSIDMLDKKLDELEERAENIGAMEELDSLFNAAADRLTKLLFNKK